MNTPKPDLWALYLQGPDEVYAMPSKAKAEEVAKRLNDTWAAMPVGMGERMRPPGFNFKAVVQPWTYSRASHAKDLLENGIAELANGANPITTGDTP